MSALFLIILLGCFVPDTSAWIRFHRHINHHHGGQCTQACKTMIANVRSELNGQLLSIKRENTHFKTQIYQLKHDLEGVKPKSAPVAFYAYLSNNLQPNGIIKYDAVSLNLGDGYNRKNGRFTAPSEGLYMFYVSTGVYYKSYVVIKLVYNNAVKDYVISDSAVSGGSYFRNQATTATPIKMKKGDCVYVETGEKGGKFIESSRYTRSSFSGVRIA